jgi:hypothetical protein
VLARRRTHQHASGLEKPAQPQARYPMMCAGSGCHQSNSLLQSVKPYPNHSGGWGSVKVFVVHPKSLGVLQRLPVPAKPTGGRQ